MAGHKTFRIGLFLKMRRAYRYATKWDYKLVETLDDSEYSLLQEATTAIKNLLATIQPPPPSV